LDAGNNVSLTASAFHSVTTSPDCVGSAAGGLPDNSRWAAVSEAATSQNSEHAMPPTKKPAKRPITITSVLLNIVNFILISFPCWCFVRFEELDADAELVHQAEKA
jgi:hypothetical protein